MDNSIDNGYNKLRKAFKYEKANANYVSFNNYSMRIIERHLNYEIDDYTQARRDDRKTRGREIFF